MGSQQLRAPIRKAMAEAVRRSQFDGGLTLEVMEVMEREATQTKQGPFNYLIWDQRMQTYW